MQRSPSGIMWRLLLCTVLLHVLCSRPAAAQQPDIAAAVADDLDTTNSKCAPLIASSCKDLEPGQGRVAQCIVDLIAAADSGSEQGTATIPDGCEEEVNQFIIHTTTDIRSNAGFMGQCGADITRLCNSSIQDGAGYKDGTVVSCLKDNLKTLSKPCQQQVNKVQLAVANDYRADAALARVCKPDAERLCPGVKDGGGRVQACLLGQRSKTTWECMEHLMDLDAAADKDLRFNVRMFHACLGDKKRFCPDIPPGNSAARDCLADSRNEEGFSTPCKEELEAMLLRRAQDFRVDTRLVKVCTTDIQTLCPEDELDEDGTSVKKCLQDQFQDIRDEDCRAMIKDYQQLAAQDIRFDIPLAEACGEDRMQLCGNVAPGSARVIRCLQTQREKLTPICQAVLFDEEVRFSDNIDFQYPMKMACQQEVERFCKNVPHGKARVIRCLQDAQRQQGFGNKCHEEMQFYEHHASQDYRLNARLRNACQGDVKTLCKDVPCNQDPTKVCGGTILRCLTTQVENITNAACAQEVRYFQFMEVQDFHNDVIMATNCRRDVEQFCNNVTSGEGRIHACLDQHYQQLSPACRRERLIHEQQVAENIELRPGLLKSCARERQLFCSAVRPGSSRAFRCLAENLGDVDFGARCRNDMLRKLQRRQTNWRLDPTLRRACRADVADMCKDADTASSEQGVVYKCLMSNSEDLDPHCKKELGRALHLAMFIWQPQQTLTGVCDAEAEQLCLQQRPNMPQVTGTVLDCLADKLEQVQAAESTSRKVAAGGPDPSQLPSISTSCRGLLELAKPPDMARTFDTTLSAALLESQLGTLEARTGVSMVNRDQQGRVKSVALTGWLAVAGVAALLVLVAAGAVVVYKRYTGDTGNGATVVLKSKRQYLRVGSSDGS